MSSLRCMLFPTTPACGAGALWPRVSRLPVQGHALYNPCTYRLQWHQPHGSFDSGSSQRLRHLCLACLKHGNDQFFLIEVCLSFPPTESELPGVGPYWWQSSFVKSNVRRLTIALGWEHPRGGGPGRKVVCTVRGQGREIRRLCGQKLCASHVLVICQT